MQRRSKKLKRTDPVAYGIAIGMRRYRRADRVPGRLAQSTEHPLPLTERVKGLPGPAPFRNTIVVDSNGNGYRALRHKAPKSLAYAQAPIATADQPIKNYTPGRMRLVDKLKAKLRCMKFAGLS